MEMKKMLNGEVVDLWSYGTPDQCVSDFEEITYEKGLQCFKSYMQAAHGMVYSRTDEVLWGKFPRHANIMMQMRSDGNVGFGGGLLDADFIESVVDCLNREYQEEFNLDLSKCAFLQNDHIVTYVNHKKKFVTHFYAHEVSNDLFCEIEKDTLHAKDWGTETFGILRVPLFVVDSDKFRGLPVFLANCFAGCARDQLIKTIEKRQIIPCENLKFALQRYKEYMVVQSSCSGAKI